MKGKITKDQMDALKFFILLSKNASEETKRTCFALIDASDGLTKSVFFTQNSPDVHCAIHDMLSSGHTTHLDQLTKLMGTDFHFNYHGGYFKEPGKLCTTDTKKPNARTIWLSNVHYDRDAREITKEQINAVVLA